MDLPAVLFGTEVPAGACWHLSLSTKAGTDRELSDAEWAEVAQEAMNRLGFEASGHRAACRWVAVRHGRSSAGNDHVHVVVNVVREDGKVAPPATTSSASQPSAQTWSAAMGSVPSRAGPTKPPCPGSPGPRLKGTPHRTGTKPNGPSSPGWCGLRPPWPAAKPSSCGSSGTPGWRPGPVTTASAGIAWWATRWPRSPPTEGWRSSSVGGSWRGTSRCRPYGTAGAPERPRTRRPPRSGLVERRRRACTRPLGPAGTSPTAGPRPQSVGARRRSGKSTGRQPSGARPGGENRPKAWAKWCASWAPSPRRT